MSAPAPRPRGTSSAGKTAVVATAGVCGVIKVGFAIFALLVVGLGIWGYQRAHSPEFKLECAAYQAHLVSMSFPDNALCLMFWNQS